MAACGCISTHDWSWLLQFTAFAIATQANSLIIFFSMFYFFLPFLLLRISFNEQIIPLPQHIYSSASSLKYISIQLCSVTILFRGNQYLYCLFSITMSHCFVLLKLLKSNLSVNLEFQLQKQFLSPEGKSIAMFLMSCVCVCVLQSKPNLSQNAREPSSCNHEKQRPYYTLSSLSAKCSRRKTNFTETYNSARLADSTQYYQD